MNLSQKPEDFFAQYKAAFASPETTTEDIERFCESAKLFTEPFWRGHPCTVERLYVRLAGAALPHPALRVVLQDGDSFLINNERGAGEIKVFLAFGFDQFPHQLLHPMPDGRDLGPCKPQCDLAMLAQAFKKIGDGEAPVVVSPRLQGLNRAERRRRRIR